MDNFDLKGYLVENRLTENSRGNLSRVHFGKGKSVLAESRNKKAETLREALQEFRASRRTKTLRENDGDVYVKSDQEIKDQLSKIRAFALKAKPLYTFDDDPDLIEDIVLKIDKTCPDNSLEIRELVRSRYRNQNSWSIGWETDEDFIYADEILDEYRKCQEEGDEKWIKVYNFVIDSTLKLIGNGNRPSNRRLNDNELNEAGYVDDDFDDDYQEDDLDFTAGDDLVSILGKDKKAKRAAEREFDDDSVDDEEFSDLEDVNDEEDDEDAEDEKEPVAPKAGSNYASQIKYNPKTVEIYMDEDELDEYLGKFRRPLAAVRTLNRAIKSTQKEVNDSPGLKSLYIVLSRGFYESRRSASNNSAELTIARVRRDPNYKYWDD